MRRIKFILLIGLLVLGAGLFGCSSDDGDDGAPGATGSAGKSAYQIAVDNGTFTGTEAEFAALLAGGGAVAATAEPESCAVCHASIETIHATMDAATDVATVSNIADSIDGGGNLVITFNIKVDGVNNDTFTLDRAYSHHDDPTLQTVPPTLVTTFVRTTIAADVVLASNGAGNYTITVPPARVLPDANYLFRVISASSTEEPVIIATNGTSPLRNLVTNEACAACHGPYPAWTDKFDHYAVGGNECQICHSQATRNTAFNSRNDDGTFTTTAQVLGTNITEYIHGIHASHIMPDDVYYRTTAADADATIEDRYSVGYPSDMRNCTVCHSDPAAPADTTRLEDVVDEPVSYYLCMTCHNNWDGFVHLHDDTAVPPQFEAGDPIMTGVLGAIHESLTTTDSCLANGCHAPGVNTTRDEVADFHNDFQADSHYDSFYRGQDISFDNINDVTFTIDDITSDGTNVSFTWSASKNGVAVDPCNTAIASGPTFQGLGAYLGYAKGDDWVNEFVSSTPGQPAGSRNLFSSLATTCSANVATTTGLTLNADALAYAEKVLLAIGGKPLDSDSFVVGAAASTQSFYVREPSPVQAFDPANGDFVAARRDAVANDKCLACHQGTLYQHGGDRVDNEQLCVICHNPASNDKNNRLDRYQIVNADGTVNTDATYDGKAAETYDMRYMIHAIHGVAQRVTETSGTPWTIYRSRGIYSFAPQLYETIGGDVFAVDYPLPTGWPAGEPSNSQAIFGSTNGSTIAHNWTVVHYPKPAYECTACHNDGAFEAVNQAIVPPMTTDAGALYPDQSDDIVIGPTAAACTACHYTAATNRHATSDFGYEAQVTKDEMLEAAQ